MLAGYVSNIDESSFSVTRRNSTVTTTVAYRDVVQVKGNNLSTGAKIAIAAGIIAGIASSLYRSRGVLRRMLTRKAAVMRHTSALVFVPITLAL